MMAKNVTYFPKSHYNDNLKEHENLFFWSKLEYYGGHENLYFQFRS